MSGHWFYGNGYNYPTAGFPNDQVLYPTYSIFPMFGNNFQSPNWNHRAPIWNAPHWNHRAPIWNNFSSPNWNRRAPIWNAPHWNHRAPIWNAPHWNHRAPIWNAPLWNNRAPIWNAPLWNNRRPNWNNKTSNWNLRASNWITPNENMTSANENMTDGNGCNSSGNENMTSGNENMTSGNGSNSSANGNNTTLLSTTTQNQIYPVQYEKTRPYAVDPTIFDSESPGIDFYYPNCGVGISVEPGEQVVVNTHVSLKLPTGMVGLIMDKSSVVTRKGLKVEAGLVDTGYRGDVKIVLRNMTKCQIDISPGEVIAQMVLQVANHAKLIKVDKIEADTNRGTRGFGGKEVKNEKGTEKNRCEIF